MKFDEIIALLGEFGKYQKLLCLFVCLPAMFNGMQVVSSVFTLFIPKHRCSLPNIENDTYKIQGYWHEILVNRSIPFVKNDDKVYDYAECNIFSTNQNTSYNALNVPLNTSRKKCDKWVYDKSVFDDTFITQINLVCNQKMARANANMIYMGGVLISAISMGIFSDIFGRKKALIVSVLLHIGGAFGSAFAPSFALFVIFRFIVGFSNIGLYMSTYVIGMELVGPSKRVAVGFIIELSFCIGLFLLCVIAFFVRSWNMLQLALACPAVLLFACLWIIPESPRWLISKGRYDGANRFIQKCAKVNGVSVPENVVDSDTYETVEKESLLTWVAVPKLLIRTLIIYFNWFVIMMVYFGLSLNVGNLKGDIYINFALVCSMELSGYMFCRFTLNKVGRRNLFAGTMIFCGVACVSTIFTMLYADDSLYWITLVLSNFGKFGVSAALGITYVWSAELFPTKVRTSGIGSGAMMAWIGSMISPYMVDLGKFVDGSFGKALPLVLFGGLSVTAGLLSLALPETSGRVLPETIEDAVNFGKDNSGRKKKSSSNKYYINEAYDKDTVISGKFKVVQ